MELRDGYWLADFNWLEEELGVIDALLIQYNIPPYRDGLPIYLYQGAWERTNIINELEPM